MGSSEQIPCTLEMKINDPHKADEGYKMAMGTQVDDVSLICDLPTGVKVWKAFWENRFHDWFKDKPKNPILLNKTFKMIDEADFHVWIIIRKPLLHPQHKTASEHLDIDAYLN